MPGMMGAIYIGLSGMGAYSQGLQTISNNVANLNSSGFKSTKVGFQDLYSYGGRDADVATGTIERGAGRGVTPAAPTIDFSQGELRATGNALDLAVEGDGFLVMLDGSDMVYGRTGQFTLDDDGYISEQASGYRLGVLDGAGGVTSINLDDKRQSAPVATTRIEFSDNLSSSGTEAKADNLSVYDGRGGRQVWTVTFTKVPDSPGGDEWTVAVTDAANREVGKSTLRFIGNMVDPATETLTITDRPAGAEPLSVVLDFSEGVTSFSGGTSSTLRASSVDGNGAGTITTIGVDDDGRIEIAYSNGKDETLDAVAIADFRDRQQLERVGGGFYRSDETAPDRLEASDADGIGSIISGQIEASNVDLADEFGSLILVQRGFQASSQVISTANDMIQQLFGIRGQG